MEKTSNKTQQGNIKIDFPDISDISQILDVQSVVLLKNKGVKSDKSLNQKGFLVNEIGVNDVKHAIDHNLKESFIIVGKNKDDKIIGYFLAYDMGYFTISHPKWLIETGIDSKIFESKKVLYGKHLASDGTVKGMGRALNIKMFNLAKDKGYSLYVGEICEGPIRNNKSINFHVNEFMMRKVGQYKDLNNFIWGVYTKEI